MKGRRHGALIVGWFVVSAAAVALANIEGWRSLAHAPVAPIIYIAGAIYWGIVGAVIAAKWLVTRPPAR